MSNANDGDSAPHGDRRSNRFRRVAIGICFLAVASLVGFEIVAQLYTRRAFAQHEKLRASDRHYFELSENDVLGYELARNRTIVSDDRTLHINKYGIRDDSDDLAADRFRIALLGASVVFGDRHALQDTISARLEAALDPDGDDVKVLNFAVPGYNLEEHAENLKVLNDVYHVDHVILILNAVDFAKRNSRFEGGDNGLYRTYHPPRFASLWLVRKAIYRYHKGGPLWNPDLVSPSWYAWLYEGNRDWGLETIKAMRDYCDEHGCGFTLSVLPPGSAYVDGKFLLADEFAEIVDYARRNDIDAIESSAEFGPEVFDKTDHLDAKGNRILADILARHMREVAGEDLGAADAERELTSAGAAGP